MNSETRRSIVFPRDFHRFTSHFLSELAEDFGNQTFEEWVVDCARAATKGDAVGTINSFLAELLSGAYTRDDLVWVWSQGGSDVGIEREHVIGIFRLIHASIGTDTPALELSDRILGAEGRAPIGGLPD